MSQQRQMFIPGNVPSLKNSKIKTSRGVFPSKTVFKYLRALGIVRYSVREKIVVGYKTRNNIFEDLRKNWLDISTGKTEKGSAVIVGFHFVRGSRHKFDFHNTVQIIADLLVAHDFIEDDDMDNFIPVPFRIQGKWYSYDKENPGVYLIVQSY